MVILKTNGGIRITINCKKLNKVSLLGQFPIPRVAEVLDSSDKGKIFSLFDLGSPFHQITVRYTKTRFHSQRFAHQHNYLGGYLRPKVVNHSDKPTCSSTTVVRHQIGLSE